MWGDEELLKDGTARRLQSIESGSALHRCRRKKGTGKEEQRQLLVNADISNMMDLMLSLDSFEILIFVIGLCPESQTA